MSYFLSLHERFLNIFLSFVGPTLQWKATNFWVSFGAIEFKYFVNIFRSFDLVSLTEVYERFWLLQTLLFDVLKLAVLNLTISPNDLRVLVRFLLLVSSSFYILMSATLHFAFFASIEASHFLETWFLSANGPLYTVNWKGSPCWGRICN